MTILRTIGGVLFFATVYLSSFFATLFVAGLALPLLVFNPFFFRVLVDTTICLWLKLPTALLEFVFGVQLKLSGEIPPKNERCLIIMNHRCELDWMFYWHYMHRYGNVNRLKIVLKHPMRFLPGIGWAMQLAGYIFLRRQWTVDEKLLNEMFMYYEKMKLPVQLLLFPEGTDLNPKSKSRSDAFALKNNLPKYEYCLHPRVKGFTYIAEKMRDQFEAILDVTMGYPAGVCYGALDSFSGRFPPEVHVHVKRYPMSEVPRDCNGLEEWCTKRWEEKEKRLQKLYNTGSFQENGCLDQNSNPPHETAVKKYFLFSICFWAVYLALCFYFIQTNRFIVGFCVIMSIVFFIANHSTDGLDWLIINMFKKYNKVII